jgi:hypothetical protein
MEAKKPRFFTTKTYIPQSTTGFTGHVHDFSSLSGVDIHLLQVQIYY